MSGQKKVILTVVGLLSLITLAYTAHAAVKKKVVTPETVTYCPVVTQVCKPCAEVENPPTSTIPQQTQCCALVTTGWSVCAK